MAFSKSFLYQEEDQIISEYFRALDYPGRLLVLRQLSKNGKMCVQDLLSGHPISKETMSNHLKILRRIHLVHWEEKHPNTIYEANTDNLLAAKKYMNHFFNQLNL